MRRELRLSLKTMILKMCRRSASPARGAALPSSRFAFRYSAHACTEFSEVRRSLFEKIIIKNPLYFARRAACIWSSWREAISSLLRDSYRTKQSSLRATTTYRAFERFALLLRRARRHLVGFRSFQGFRRSGLYQTNHLCSSQMTLAFTILPSLPTAVKAQKHPSKYPKSQIVLYFQRSQASEI